MQRPWRLLLGASTLFLFLTLEPARAQAPVQALPGTWVLLENHASNSESLIPEFESPLGGGYFNPIEPGGMGGFQVPNDPALLGQQALVRATFKEAWLEGDPPEVTVTVELVPVPQPSLPQIRFSRSQRVRIVFAPYGYPGG